MKVLFMGTPDFAVSTLKAIIEAGHEVIGVVTQPDKARGRGGKKSFPAVKEAALKYNLDVYQPVKVREPDFIQKVSELQPEVIVVAAFGQLLPKKLLDIPPYGSINVHASLLPKYRGAAPIQAAIINGDKETGITIMYMGVKLDVGDMILQESIPITNEDTAGSLHDKLALLGGTLLVKALDKLKDGSAERTPQDDSKATHVKMMDKDIGNIDFTQPAIVIERKIRGLNAWPSAYTQYDGKNLKIWGAEVVECSCDAKPGEVIERTKDSFTVMTGENALLITELQMECKKRLPCGAFLQGCPIKKGIILGK